MGDYVKGEILVHLLQLSHDYGESRSRSDFELSTNLSSAFDTFSLISRAEISVRRRSELEEYSVRD